MKMKNRFNEFSSEGEEFKRMWMNADRDGIQGKIAEKFQISIPTVYRIRKLLNLPDLHSREHPGRRKLERRVKRLYLWGYKKKGLGGISTLRIAKILKMSSQNVNQILRKNGIKLGPQHVTNVLYFKTRSNITPAQLASKIKKMYLNDHLPAVKIAEILKLDQGTVANKLRAMDIKMKQNHKALKGNGDLCQWCSKEMKTMWQVNGPRKQKFCDHRCKNMAKDYRRMLKGLRPSETRMIQFENFLKGTWKDKYDTAVSRILDVQPMNTGEI